MARIGGYNGLQPGPEAGAGLGDLLQLGHLSHDGKFRPLDHVIQCDVLCFQVSVVVVDVVCYHLGPLGQDGAPLLTET